MVSQHALHRPLEMGVASDFSMSAEGRGPGSTRPFSPQAETKELKAKDKKQINMFIIKLLLTPTSDQINMWLF